MITHNLCLQHFRQAARRPRQVELEDDTAAVVSDEQGLRVDDLVRALREIPVSQRAALVMRELEGRPIAEIAGVLGVSVSAVETLLFRAQKCARATRGQPHVRGGRAGDLEAARRFVAARRARRAASARAPVRGMRSSCAQPARATSCDQVARRRLLPVGLAWSKFGPGAAVSGVASAGAGTAASGGAWLRLLTAKLVGATRKGSSTKRRPLGIPVILDRCHQARVVSALEPEWEARFEPKSYGFRPGRGCHDAIDATYQVVKGRSPKRQWALDADLASAFDRIAHDHILAMLGTFPARGMVAQWLKAGVVEQGRLHRTEDGVPQGGVVSPVLLNVALHGMEQAAGVRYDPTRLGASGLPGAGQVRRRSRAPRGAIRPGGDERTPPWACRSRLVKMGAA